MRTAAHGRHLYHWCMDKFGDMKFDMGDEILVDSPLYQTIMGTKPKTFKDFNEGLYYLEEEVVQLLAATHTGQESAFIDFESKALHAGMLDLLGMEICDMLQIVAYDMPRGAADAPSSRSAWAPWTRTRAFSSPTATTWQQALRP